MKKRNLFFALLLGAVASFTSCSKDDDLTPEEIEAKEKQELVDGVTANFNTVTTTEWAYKEFQPSEDLLAASETEDGLVALTTIQRSEHVAKLKPILSFEANGDSMKVNVDFNLSQEDVFAQLLEIQAAMYPWAEGMDYIVFGEESFSADFRRVIAAPLAADNLGTDDITSEETGLCIFSIAMRDFSELSYEDAVLAQKQLVAGNSDKIYFNEDGTLTVETTSADYGVSKLILEEVK